MFKTIKENVQAEITEKKSKFICNMYHVESVEEVNDILKKLRKKYHDARHNCYAYRLIKDNISRSSDDGEPSGTAGIPMLNILNGNDLSNVLVVVTRYFGGILLGTGGLVRAYSLATTKAIECSKIYEQELGVEVSFLVDYKSLEEIKYYLNKISVKITNLNYGEKIKIIAEGSKKNIEKIVNNEISERVKLLDVAILREKYIHVD